MRVLVTGGAGFIGSHYVRTLLGGGYPGYEQARVTVLDKLTYAGNLANLEPVSGSSRLDFVRGDICDAALLASVLPGHDVVLNFAGETHVDRERGGVRRNQRGRRADPAAGVLGSRGAADGADLDGRGLRHREVRFLDRTSSAAAQLTVCGGRRPPR
jgi:uncharacterized protein YbjT (DUF2867 family)